MKVLSLLLLLSPALPVAFAQTPTARLHLWDGPAPGAPDRPGPEIQEPAGRVSHVSDPTLDVYLPPPGRSNGTAIIICSGGGYRRLASGPLGQGAAAVFVPQGFTVFSLKYRLSPPSRDVRRDSLADVKRAVRLVRSHAEEWRVDPRRVGLAGFSAGSHLILNLATHSDPGQPSSPDPVKRESSRPDFIALCCPWPDHDQVADYPIDSRVPPAFIAHARDDGTAPFAFGEGLAAAWKAAGISVDFEAYPTGGHEGFNFPTPANPDWTVKFVAWLRKLGFAP